MKNNRTFLEKLLDGAEVKWIPLGDVADYEQPTKYLVNSTVYNDNYPTPVLTAGKTFILGYTNEDEGIYFASKSPVIIFDDFTTANKWVDFDFKAKSSAMKMITSKNEKFALLKYIYYWLNTLPNNQIDSDHKRQWISNYANKLIPIPPLPVQTEIVKILDALTALTSELTSELILRQKQYEYYREKLLSFDSLELFGGVVQWVKLIDLGELIRGNGLQKKDFTETGVPAIHYGQIYTYYGTFATKTKSFVSPELAKKLKKAKYGDVLIAGTSENLKDVMKPLGWLGSEIAFSGDMFAFRPNKRVNTKFLTYILQTERFYKFKEKYAQGTKVIRVKADNFLNYEIPLPTFEEQQRIVSILDKFETLTNSITEGLPLAIEQSQKRYEYYRELLLNFS